MAYISTKLQIQGLKAELPEVMDWMEKNVLEQSRELDPVKRQQLVWDIQERASQRARADNNPGMDQHLSSLGEKILKGFKGYDLYSYTKSVMNERMWIADN